MLSESRILLIICKIELEESDEDFVSKYEDIPLYLHFVL